MSLPERSPYIRVLPGTSYLDIILKNTHFPDDLLAETSVIQAGIQWQDGLLFLVVHFKSPAYDFSEPLIPADLKNGERGWLQQSIVTVRLLLADNVFADKVTERTVALSERDSGQVRDIFVNIPDSAVPGSDSPATLPVGAA